MKKQCYQNKIYSLGDTKIWFDADSDFAVMCYNLTGTMSIWGEDTSGVISMYSLNEQTGQITFQEGFTMSFRVINYGNTLLNEDG